MKKRVVVALGHRALGNTFPEQQTAVRSSASALAADLVDYHTGAGRHDPHRE